MEEGVYLLKLELESVRCFEIDATLDLSNNIGHWQKWTIILGDNGTGKTTLLQCISAFEQREVKYRDGKTKFQPNVYKLEDGKESLLKKSMERFVISAVTNITQDKSLEYDLGILYSKKDDRGLYTIHNIDSKYKFLEIYGYGANRFMSRNSLTELKSENSTTLFDDDAKLINAEEWLLQLDYSASKKSSIQEFASKRRDQVKEILLELLPKDGITDIRFTEPTKENLKSTVEFKTPYGWVTIHQLSLGYKTMVAWMVDLAARMFERYPDSDNPLAEPAIVLVDEIDLHMHPKWQRKIFDYLSEKFPKTQFIVTAHSPLIVQSAPRDANIVLLRREGDHVVIDNDIKSVHNWRIDQILNSDLFGNISQRKPDVEDWMKEREELLLKETLETYEKKRLKELEEQTDQIPTAGNQRDIEAMEIIRKAADYLKTQTA